jgi:cbb3-type cytochrome oxidase maturation protein
MSVLIVLISCSILVAAAFLAAFIFSAKKGQFDDTYSPGRRILFDDTKPVPDKEAGEPDGNRYHH